ncbi:Undecaprenyl-phosphate 4-deoxy-4-formamido-L-arabinose transferase [Luteitalea pratensis]|uniref:Undecaprenyl-phosphate 4-deoxy-4-formamido-L-arabinose transferase n=1 Tax=Luteitalea pratensis TaxID=1855912 RepID=A0A143PST7_LUTPR|nr:glycosyltransferase family 2 protein [Luteitalea pratensis]AMY11705.1 Undecaprenyl-phosphate 4-deoxy-4-formamido-L-arabinose transferase [Luteitalea pratensis]
MADATRLSLVIPAHNEAEGITPTLRAFSARLRAEGIPFELVVVDDHSTDGTAEVLAGLSEELPELRRVENPRPGGFGHAVLAGLEQFNGDAVCIVMADASDDPADVVTYYQRLSEGFDCVFGSRFVRGAKVVDYPRHKLLLNRLANTFIRLLFGLRLNDTTNAFKCYRRGVIAGCQPLLSKHFNLTVELPLKAIVRGYSYTVVPINWYNRTTGVSKLKLKEMGSRYLFIVLYVWLEKVLSRGDYSRRSGDASGRVSGDVRR